MNKIEINDVIKEINLHTDDDDIWDPDAQLEGYGTDYDEEEINESELPERSKFNPNKASLMLETITESDSLPIFFQNPTDKYDDFDEDIVGLNKIIATNSPGVYQGKELYAIHQMVGHNMWTVTPPVEINKRQVVSRLDSVSNGIETMIPNLRLFPTHNKKDKRSIVYVGSGNRSLNEQFIEEIKRFLKPRKFAVSLGGNEKDESAAYFLMVTLSPSEVSKVIGLESDDPSLKKFTEHINYKNELLNNNHF